MGKFFDPIFLYALILFTPLVGIIMNQAFYKKNPVNTAFIARSTIWIGFVLSSLSLANIVVTHHVANMSLFHLNGLAMTMNMLIFFVSAIVHQFSNRYMSGDSQYRRYYFSLSAITLTASIMVCADHMVLFSLAWAASNFLLVSLMIHKRTWLAAKNSGVLALKSLMLGSLSMLVAFCFFYKVSGSFSIDFINHQLNLTTSPWVIAGLVLVTLTAFIQSAQWPFQSWLTSSLNSPTPVSGLMHAGLVNGGGLILVKFAPLLISTPFMLTLIFLVGAITAIIGTFWKLLQTDIKKLLACSTMAQMGFMMMQCGLGLFAAAIAHLCWHGLFKSFLFLNAGSTLQAKRSTCSSRKRNLLYVVLSCFIGLLGAYCFAIVSEKSIFTLQPTTFLVGFAFISGAQLAYTLLQFGKIYTRFIPICALVSLAGVFYGESIHFIESFLPIITLDALPALNGLHFSIFALFMLLWLSMPLIPYIQNTKLWGKLYMASLNASQPHPSTITTSRSTYQY